MNLAFGYVSFARDEKNLFRFLYLERPTKPQGENMFGMKESFLAEFGAHSKESHALAELQASGQEALVRYTWVFTHGLAMLVNSGALGQCSDQVILRLLMDAGEAFYRWGIGKGGDDKNDS